jgi:ABC-type glycerol-3-phosphate transport system substrate-binding protein
MINRRSAVSLIAAGAIAPIGRPASAQAQTTITLWHYQTGNRDALRVVLDRFEAANPTIKVNDVLKNNETMASEIQAAAMANRAPDVGQVLGRLVVGMIRNAGAQPLDGLPESDALERHIIPNFLAIGRYRGRLYAVPHSFGTPVVYVNRGILRDAGLNPDEPPRTWQEMRQQARQIRERTNKIGLYVAQGGRDVAAQQMMTNAGADMMDAELKRATFSTPETIEAMQLWQDMAVQDKSYGTLTERELGALFMGGQIAMMVQSIATFQEARRNAEGKFELGIAHYPRWKSLPRRVANSGSTMLVFSRDPQRRAAAMKLIAYLMAPDVTNPWAVDSGYLPLDPRARESELVRSYLAQEPRWRVAVDQMQDTIPTARWPGNRVVEIQIVIENMVQALVQGRGAASDLVPAAERQVSAIIAQSA